MKTYILKTEISNSIDFPIGTIVKVNDPKWELEVVEGKLKGKKCHIADGVKDYIINDTPENREKCQIYIDEVKRICKMMRELNKAWYSLPSTSDFEIIE